MLNSDINIVKNQLIKDIALDIYEGTFKGDLKYCSDNDVSISVKKTLTCITHITITWF